MIYYLYGLHLLVVVSWAIFLLQFIKSLQNRLSDRYLFGYLSLILMFIVLFIGTKMILLNPAVAKSGKWLHTKLSFDILLMIENLALFVMMFKDKFFSSKTYEWLYWFSYASFMIMLGLSVFKPF